MRHIVYMAGSLLTIISVMPAFCGDDQPTNCTRITRIVGKVMIGGAVGMAMIPLLPGLLVSSIVIGGIVWPATVYYYDRELLWPCLPGVPPLINTYENRRDSKN